MEKRHRNRYTGDLREIVAFAEQTGEGTPRWKLLLLGGASVPQDRVDELFAWTPAKLASLRREMRAFLRSLVSRHDDRVMLGAPVRLRLTLRPRISPRGFASAPWEPAGHVGLDIIDGSIRSIVFFNLITLLRRAGIACLRRCSTQECERVFVKSGRRSSCSDACYRKQYMREHRRGELRKDKKGSRDGKTTRKR